MAESIVLATYSIINYFGQGGAMDPPHERRSQNMNEGTRIFHPLNTDTRIAHFESRGTDPGL